MNLPKPLSRKQLIEIQNMQVDYKCGDCVNVGKKKKGEIKSIMYNTAFIELKDGKKVALTYNQLVDIELNQNDSIQNKT